MINSLILHNIIKLYPKIIYKIFLLLHFTHLYDYVFLVGSLSAFLHRTGALHSVSMYILLSRLINNKHLGKVQLVVSREN